jgi:hypothetical protein
MGLVDLRGREADEQIAPLLALAATSEAHASRYRSAITRAPARHAIFAARVRERSGLAAPDA